MSKQTPNLPYNPKTMTVVIIDDHDPIRKAIRRVLSQMGFSTVLEYSDGHDALKILGKKPVDLIITDIFMRKVDGFKLLRKIRSQNFGADIPIIVVTGESSKEDIVKTVDLGADDYILKPFQISDLEKKVTSVLLKYHSPSPILAMLRHADKLSIQDMLEDALKLYEAAERLDGQNPRAKLGKALVLEKMGHGAQSLAILKESSEENPTYYKNFKALADIYLIQERKQAAIEALRSELELNPRQSERQILLAELLHAEGDFIGAIEHFRAALIESPKSKIALLGTGKSYAAAGNNEKALHYFKRARRQHPTFTIALRLMMDIHEQDGNSRGALFELMDEVRNNPGRPDARVLLAETYSKDENYEGAAKVIDEGLSRDPQSVILLKAKGKLLFKTNDNTGACNAYKKVAEIEPSEAHQMLFGEALLSDQKLTEAYQCFFSALAIATNRQKLLSRIAETLKRMGYSAQAMTLLLAARNMDGPIPAANFAEEIKLLMPVVLRRRNGGPVKKTG